MKYAEKRRTIAYGDYGIAFWDYARGSHTPPERLGDGLNNVGTGYFFPNETDERLEKGIEKESAFRKIASVFNKYEGSPNIWAYDSNDTAGFVEEGGLIADTDIYDDFTKINLSSHKLAAILKAPEDFIMDSGFDIENYLIKKISKSFAKAEDKAFVTGTGTNEPTGILHNTSGASVGITTASSTAVTYDEVITLYFSVDKEYRKNAVWLMNNTTALALRTLKDENGNYLWEQATDTILGKQVIICDYMPDIGAGKKPIAFGDFSYYWVVKRSPICIKTLVEKYAISRQTGFLTHEFLDGKLIRSDAVKVLKVKA